VIIHGLQPERDYDIQLNIDGKQTTSMSVRTMSADEKLPSGATPSSQLQAASAATMADTEDVAHSFPYPVQSTRVARPHTPPMQDTEIDLTGNDSVDVSIPETSASGLSASCIASGGEQAMTAAEVQAAIRKARKDASRAESALRNEIEAIKRALDRMSDVDHRSKQKVLALQESIRQATTQAREIDEEAIVVESEREAWEERERSKEEELNAVRKEVEEKIRTHQQQIKSDREAVETMEKKLDQVMRSTEEKTTAREKIEKEKTVELEHRLAQMHAEIESALARPTPTQMYYHGAQYPTNFSNGRGGRHVLRGAAPTAPRGRGNQHAGGQQPHGIRAGFPTQTQGRAFNAPYPGGHEADEYAIVYGHGAPYYDASSQAHQNTTLYQPSRLNPQNPEFVPAATSGMLGSTTSPLVLQGTHLPLQQPHQQQLPRPQEHSPVALTNRFTFSPHLNETDPARRNSGAYMDSGVLQSTPLAPMVDASAAASSSWATPGNMSPWATSSTAIAASPQLGPDIWRSPVLPTVLPAGSSPQNQLRNKTSMPFPLRANNNDTHLRNSAFLYPNDNNGSGDGPVKQGNSAPTSPSQPSEEAASRNRFAL
jgi:hypothetical protein